MKQLFKNKYLEISLIKGFVFGIGISDINNTNYILFFGPITIDIVLPKKIKRL